MNNLNIFDLKQDKASLYFDLFKMTKTVHLKHRKRKQNKYFTVTSTQNVNILKSYR